MRKSNTPSQGEYTLKSVHHKGGGSIFSTVLNLVLDVVAPPVGAAMHAVRAAYDVSQGNILGAIGNAFGAYGAGGGFSEGGFGSTFGDAAASGVSNNMISDFDVGMAGDTFGDSWSEMAGGINPNDYSYALGGETFAPSELPFNANGYDIAGTGSANPLADAGSYSPDSSSLNMAAQAPMNTGLNSMLENTGVDAYSAPKIDTVTGGAGDNTLSSNIEAPSGPSMDMGGNNMSSDYDSGIMEQGGYKGINGGLGQSTFGSAPGNSTSAWGTGSEGSINGQLPQSPYKFAPNNAQTGMGTSPTLTPNSGAGATMSTSQPTLWDQITKGAGQLGDKFMANPVPNSIKAGGTLYGMYNQNQAAEMLKRAASQQDPFGPQRAEYQRLLSQSYQDPQAIYNSPQYQGLNSIFQKQIAARDAAAGRNSQYGARAAESQANFMKYLDDYRARLMAPAGANINPAAQGNLYASAAQQQKNMGDTLIGGLNSIFGSPSY